MTAHSVLGESIFFTTRILGTKAEERYSNLNVSVGSFATLNVVYEQSLEKQQTETSLQWALPLSVYSHSSSVGPHINKLIHYAPEDSIF